MELCAFCLLAEGLLCLLALNNVRPNALSLLALFREAEAVVSRTKPSHYFDSFYAIINSTPRNFLDANATYPFGADLTNYASLLTKPTKILSE